MAGKASKKAAKTRSRHGLTVLKARVMVRGFAAIDMRTAAAQTLKQWRSELLDALGGAESISPQKAALVDAACRTRMLLDSADRFLFSLETPINKKKRCLLPVARERETLVGNLLRLLTALGLERVPRDAGGIPPEWITKVEPYAGEPEPDGLGDEETRSGEPLDAPAANPGEVQA